MKKLISVLVLSIVVASCGTNPTPEIKKENKLLLPVFGMRKAGNNGDTIYHQIGEFSFTNQFGETVSNQTFDNKIYVADFFFASCTSICPTMSTQFGRIQKEFVNDSSVLLLSHTVNPMNDTVEVLNTYGGKYGAIKGKWHMVTGNKKTIYDLAAQSYLVNALEDDGSEEGFLHSETFILIDKQKRIRGIYDGTDSTDVNRLMKEIKVLKTETN